jgi:hypothetical protein
MKIYVAAVEALNQKERQDETQSATKFDGFFFLVSPSLNPLMYFYFQVYYLLNHLTAYY